MKKDSYFNNYKYILFLTLSSALFFLALILCGIELIFVLKSPQDHFLEHNHKSFFIGLLLYLLLSGIFMMMVFLGTVLNLFRSYDEAKKINRFSDTRMKAIEASREGISILNENGDFIYMNHAYAMVYGYEDVNDLIGKNWRTLYSPKEQFLLDQKISHDLIHTGWWAGHAVGRKKDGQEFPQEISLTMLETGGMVVVLRDISQYIQKENSMQIIKIAIDSAADGIFIIDDNNKFSFVNSSFLKMHGLNEKEKNLLFGTDWRLNYSKKVQDFINSTILPKTILKGAWNGGTTIYLKSDSEFYADLSLTKLPNNLILGVIRDASEKKALDLEREKLREQMYQAQKMDTITRLIKGMSGDFKLSISTIKANIEKAFEYDEIPEERKKFMSNILLATKNADEKISQLMSLSFGKNINSGIVDAVDVSLQVNNSMVRQYQSRAKFSVITKIDSANIFADFEQFKNCISGLCLNALEAINKENGEISIFVSDTFKDPLPFHDFLELKKDDKFQDIPKIISNNMNNFIFCGGLKPKQKYIRLSVNDNGAGISSDAMPNIFDPFFSSKQDGTSIGMGLSSIKGIVLSYKGAIVVESTIGKGTSTHIFVPLAEDFSLNVANTQFNHYIN